MNNKIFKSILVLLIILTFYSHLLLAQTQEGVVKRVIDGNTVELDTGQTVRYIGVAVPDPAKPDKCFGKEALEFNRNLVVGKKIRLEYDEKVKDNELFLAYVYQDSVFVNAEIIKQGYGSVFIVSPNVKFASEFIKLEAEAKQAKRGMWEQVRPAQTENPTTQDISSLEKRIYALEAKVEELNSKLDQLVELVKTLQSQSKDVKTASSENQAIASSTKNPQQAKIQSKTDDPKSELVYVSKTGTKYHKLNCRFLIGEPKAMSIEEAKRKGLVPCKICFPETSKKENDNQK